MSRYHNTIASAAAKTELATLRTTVCRLRCGTHNANDSQAPRTRMVKGFVGLHIFILHNVKKSRL